MYKHGVDLLLIQAGTVHTSTALWWPEQITTNAGFMTQFHFTVRWPPKAPRARDSMRLT